MEQWQHGDLSSFEELFRKYEKLVFKNAFLITGSMDKAEEVVQDVFLSIWRYRETFDSKKAKFATWLHHITVNECLRKKKQTYETILFDKLDIPDKACLQPEELLITKSEYESLLKMLRELNKKHRLVVVLKYFNDLSYAEIAEVLNIPLGTVKSRLNHALSCIKERLVLEKETKPEVEEERGL
ncbi:MAG: RNA polymerase sigma factor [Dehalococcoidia bacterium]|nr:MAG: RNA polymerase sigma factor [Dehalococcoidia bacterium]